MALCAVFPAAGATIVDLGTLFGLGSSPVMADGVNNSGQVVVTTTGPNGPVDAYLYTPGSGVTDLGSATGLSSVQARAINDAGQILLNTYNSGVIADSYLYTPGSGLTDLGALTGLSAPFGIGINDSGQMLFDRGNDAYLYTPGQGLTDLDSVTGLPEPLVAPGINNQGQILLFSNPAPPGTQDVQVYTPGSGLTDTGYHHPVGGITDAGEIVGNLPPSGPGVPDAILLNEGVVTDVNTLLPADSGWDLQTGGGISASGEFIVGQGLNPQGHQQGYLLDTAPEPASLALFAAGALLVALMRKRFAALMQIERQRS